MKKTAIVISALVLMLLIGLGVRQILNPNYRTLNSTSISAPEMGSGYAGDNSLGTASKFYRDGGSVDVIVPPSGPATISNPTLSASADTTVGLPRMIIKTGNMSLVVENVELAVNQIKQFAEANGGFVVGSNIYERSTTPMANITIRVPVGRFDSSLSSISEYGELISQSVSGNDVTEEFVDLEAQIRNLKSTEEQFLVIMRQATLIEDILAVQRELSHVRSQIERIEGRMNFLSKGSEMSTLSIQLATNPELLPIVGEPSWKPLAVVKDALRSLRVVGIAFVSATIWFVIYLPVWAVMALIGWMVYKKVNKK